jgi:MscS family membrane protein
MGLVESILSNKTYYVTAIFIILIIVIWMLILIFRVFVNRVILKQFTKREHSIQRTEGIFVIIIFLIGVDVALQRVLYQEDIFFKILRTVLTVVITFFVAEIASFLLEVWGRHMGVKKGKEFQEEVLPLAQSTVKVFLFVIALVIVLELWGVQIWTLLASIGVVGIVIGLALNDSLKNVFAGISLILDRTFRAGDVIEIDNSIMGEVVMINLRSTRLLTYDEKIVSVPNSVLANTRITNFSQPSNLLRLTMDFSVAYGSDVNEVEECVKKSVLTIKSVLDHPLPEVRLIKMNEYSLDFRAEIFVRFQSIKMLEDVKDALIRNIYETLTKNKIDIPYETKVSVSIPMDPEKLKQELKKKKSFLKGKLG